jgi:excisionase family DNA binding protein
LCQVDLKTIHNWVDRGRIAHFRTPGRHLRFRAADVADFLRTWGYTVPRELARASAKSVAFVGSEEALAIVSKALPNAAMKHLPHPYDALVLAGADPPDVYIIDVASVGNEVDVNRVLEVLHRACPQVGLVALCDELPGMPSFVTRLARSEAASLAPSLVTERPPEPVPGVVRVVDDDEEPARR